MSNISWGSVPDWIVSIMTIFGAWVAYKHFNKQPAISGNELNKIFGTTGSKNINVAFIDGNGRVKLYKNILLQQGGIQGGKISKERCLKTDKVVEIAGYKEIMIDI